MKIVIEYTTSDINIRHGENGLVVCMLGLLKPIFPCPYAKIIYIHPSTRPQNRKLADTSDCR